MYTFSQIMSFILMIAIGETDVRNFDFEFTNERAVDSVVTNHLTGTMAAKSDFENFTYTGSGNI